MAVLLLLFPDRQIHLSGEQAVSARNIIPYDA